MKILVADVETIGLAPPPPPASGVVQVAWAEICPTTLDILDVQSHLVNPQASIHPEAAKIHGYTNADVDHLHPLEYVYAPAGPTVLIAHNFAFDSKFLSRYTENLAGSLCTLTLARHYVRNSKNHKLATLAEHFGLDAGKAHDAGGDVRTTVQLLRILVELSGRSLDQLIAANKPRNFHVMPFGMFKGSTFDKLPLGYLKWFIAQDIDADLRYSLEQQLKVR